jgi:DNA-binding GntR family transcriptional regulator
MGDYQRPPTAQEAVLAELRARILRGDLPAGAALRQEELADSLGVSRVPVREALRMLEAEGHVSYAAHRGYRVAELGIEDLVETYHLRALIEDDLVRRSMATLTEQDLARVETAHAALAALEASALHESALHESALHESALHESGRGQPSDAGRPAEALARANRAFHWAILRPGPRADRILGTLWDTSDAHRARWFADPGNVAHGSRAHRAIMAAVRSGEVEAVVAQLRDHRESAVRALRAALAPAPGGRHPARPEGRG